MATDAPFMQRHQRAIMLVLVLMVIPTFGIAGPEIYAFIETLRNPLKDAVGTFELEPGETVGVSEKEFLDARQNLWTVRGMLGAGDAPSPEIVWSHIIKVAKARHLGIAVSDQDLAAVLRRMGFAANPEIYRSLVSSRGLTVTLFEKLVREIMLTEKLDELEGTPPLLTADRVYEKFKTDKRRYKLDTVTFAAASYEEKVDAAAWTDEDLQKSWDDGANAIVKNGLRIPAKYTLDVAYAPFDTYPLDELGDLLQGIDANESEMLNQYANPLAQDRYRAKKDDAAAGTDDKPPLRPFDEVKETIRREIKIRKVLDKAYGEAAEMKKAIDDAKAERDRLAEEALRKAEEERQKAESSGGDGSGTGTGTEKPAETGTPAETPKTPDEKKMPPEPLQDGAAPPPPPPAAEAAPEAAAPDDRLDLTPVIEKYKLSRVKLESLDDKALKTAQLTESLQASINVLGLGDRSLVTPFEGPGAVAGFGVVSGYEADRMPELSAVKEEFRTALKDKKAFDLAYEDAQALQKEVKARTEARNEAKKPASIRERELRQKEAEEAAKKQREEAEQKAKEEAEKAKADAEKAKEGAAETPAGDPPKKEEEGSKPPAGEKPPGDGGGLSDLPPPAPPQGDAAAPPDAAPPVPSAEKELTEPEWSELMLTDLGVSFDEYVKEKGLEVRTTDWLTFALRNSPELAEEKDPQVKYLRGIGGIRNLRIGQVNIYRDNDAKAAYAVKMKEKQDPAWEELSSERAAEILTELYRTSNQNRGNIMAQMGFENLAREVKLATLLRTQAPPATTGLPPRRMP